MNYRKCLLTCVFIYLVIFILLSFLQLIKKCQNIPLGEVVRVEKRLIVGEFDERGLKNFQKEYFYAYRVSFGAFSSDKPEMMLGKRVVVEGRAFEVVQDVGQEVVDGKKNNFMQGITAQLGGYFGMGKAQVSPSGEGNRSAPMLENINCKIALIDARIVDIKENYGSVLSPISHILRILHVFQQKMVSVFQTHLTEPHASLALGILFGVDATLPDWFYQQLVTTGTIHVITASGYNVSIVSSLVYALLQRFFSKRVSTYCAMVCIGGYVLIAGASPAIMRAGIMGLLALFSQVQGRVYWAQVGLILSSLMMLFFSPLLLLSASFQLSVAAIAGILWILPLLTVHQSKNKTEKPSTVIEKMREYFKECLFTTLAASSTTMPIILVTFGSLSIVSFLANTVLLWIIPLCMCLSAMLVVINLTFPFLTPLVAIGVWSITQLFILGIGFFASVPFASFQFESVSIVVLPLWYGILFIIYRKYRKTV